jgi:uncharacterized protein YjiS (DUF1127 family)
MSTILARSARAPATPTDGSPSFAVDASRAARSALSTWRQRARTRAALAALDADRLADIGLTARERDRECAKWFWEA